jgi:hypothetical protein
MKSAPFNVAVVALANAAMQLVVSFGVSLTDAQNAAITGLVNALLLVGALFVHTGSTPPPPAPPAPPPPPPLPPAPPVAA